MLRPWNLSKGFLKWNGFFLLWERAPNFVLRRFAIAKNERGNLSTQRIESWNERVKELLLKYAQVIWACISRQQFYDGRIKSIVCIETRE